MADGGADAAPAFPVLARRRARLSLRPRRDHPGDRGVHRGRPLVLAGAGRTRRGADPVRVLHRSDLRGARLLHQPVHAARRGAGSRPDGHRPHRSAEPRGRLLHAGAGPRHPVRAGAGAADRLRTAEQHRGLRVLDLRPGAAKHRQPPAGRGPAAHGPRRQHQRGGALHLVRRQHDRLLRRRVVRLPRHAGARRRHDVGAHRPAVLPRRPEAGTRTGAFRKTGGMPRSPR